MMPSFWQIVDIEGFKHPALVHKKEQVCNIQDWLKNEDSVAVHVFILFWCDCFSDAVGSESEYSEIEENIYGQSGYHVRWGWGGRQAQCVLIIKYYYQIFNKAFNSIAFYFLLNYISIPIQHLNKKSIKHLRHIIYATLTWHIQK